METITYLNIKVEGVPYTKILSLHIQNAINGYGSAYIEGEIDSEKGNAYVQRLTSDTIVKITTTADGQPPILFMGVVAGSSVSQETDYTLLKLQLFATAHKLNYKKKNQSFQNAADTYTNVITKALDGMADLQMNVSDKAIGSLIMRYNETSWEFAQRMASTFGAPISANVNTEKPLLTVGMPKTGKTYNVSDAKIGFSSESQTSYGGTVVTSAQYVYLGDKICVGNKTETVQEYESSLDYGILTTKICLMSKDNENKIASGTNDSPVQRPITNVAASGKMFTGVVQAVQKDKVQVHLTSIDAEYDAGGTHWFPYSTAYSSSDGSGFYCMPAVGDTVRVFFPSDNEADAFAASSVNVSPLDDPLHKKWRSPAGKEILFTPEGLLISCKDDKIFIDLTDEEGVKICSEKDITINAQNNLTLYAKKTLKMQAENKVLLSSGESYIDMSKDLIEMGANQVLIN